MCGALRVLSGFMQPMQLFENKAIAVHMRGKTGAAYERPWKAENSSNPLAQWAEKKKAEAAAADAKKAD